MTTTTALRRTRTRKASAPTGGIDGEVVAVLAKHGATDPLSLLARLRTRPAGEVVDAAVRLVLARAVRVDAQGRFVLPEVTA